MSMKSIERRRYDCALVLHFQHIFFKDSIHDKNGAKFSFYFYCFCSSAIIEGIGSRC